MIPRALNDFLGNYWVGCGSRWLDKSIDYQWYILSRPAWLMSLYCDPFSNKLTHWDTINLLSHSIKLCCFWKLPFTRDCLDHLWPWLSTRTNRASVLGRSFCLCLSSECLSVQRKKWDVSMCDRWEHAVDGLLVLTCFLSPSYRFILSYFSEVLHWP